MQPDKLSPAVEAAAAATERAKTNRALINLLQEQARTIGFLEWLLSNTTTSAQASALRAAETFIAARHCPSGKTWADGAWSDEEAMRLWRVIRAPTAGFDYAYQSGEGA